jgi:hypothetical protein
MNKAQTKQTLFKVFRYSGLLVTALGVALVLVPGAWLEMPEGVAGYMILGGSILNATGRLSRESIVRSLESAVPGSQLDTHRSTALAIAEGLQDATLLL